MSMGARAKKKKSSPEVVPDGRLAMFQHLPAPLFIVQEGRIRHANVAAETCTGYSRAELAKLTLCDIAHPDFRAACREREDNWQRGDGLPARFDLWIRTKSGDDRWLDCSVVAEEFESAPAFLALTLDITARKQAEIRLGESEDKLARVFRCSPAGILLSNPNAGGLIVEANEELERISGYARSEMVGRSTQQLGIWADPQDRERGLDLLKQHGRVSNFEVNLRRKDGEIRTVLLSAELLQVGDRELLVSTILDITARKQTEEALRRERKLFHAIVQDQNEMIVRWTPDGTRTFVNQAYCRTFGATYEQLVGTSFWPLVIENHRERERKRIRQLKPDTPHSMGLHESYLPDGTTQWQEWVDRASFDDDGQVVEIQSVGRDISERIRAEEALRDLSLQLLRAEDNERRRIAQELHDSTAQELVAATWQLQLLRKGIPSGASSSEDAARLEQALALLAKCAHDLRTLAYALYPPRLDATGLTGTISQYAAGFAERTGIAVTVEAPDEIHLRDDVELVLFRVVQQCLSNIHLHAQSPTAQIRLIRMESSIVLEVSDVGVGFVVAPNRSVRGGVGIRGMDERLRQVGGELAIQSGARGTTVRAVIPVSQATG